MNRKLLDESYESGKVSLKYIGFLFSNLSRLILRDQHALINLKYDYSYISKLNKDNIYALHISDLHMKVSQSVNSVDKNFLEEIKMLDVSAVESEEMENDLEDRKIDLLYITGDIVQGAGTAVEMELRYEQAKDILFDVAQQLWSYDFIGKLRMRADWKKRVLIVPGNHDYSAMNESMTRISDRNVVSSGMGKQGSGVMVRFAYYINFLRKYLDTDLKIIDANLNYSRIYKNLGIKIIGLNSCANINFLRSNKVGLKYQKGDHPIKHKSTNDIKNICVLMHHSPRYVTKDMDYGIDKYIGMINPLADSSREKAIGNLLAIFDKVVNGGKSLDRGAIENKLQYLFNIVNNPVCYRSIDGKELNKEDIKEIKKKISSAYDEFEKNIQHILDNAEEGYRGIALNQVSAMSVDIDETVADKADYFINLKEILDVKQSSNNYSNKIDQNLIFCGGHIHKKRWEQCTINAKDTNNTDINRIDEIANAFQKTLVIEAGNSNFSKLNQSAWVIKF